MAMANMGMSHASALNAPEILYNAEYVGDAITLDTAAFTEGVCKAGTPIDAYGAIANTASARGVLLRDVYEERPQGTIVIGGFINTARAQAHSGVEIAEAAKAAMKNVVFR